jgi:hypothetical protein
MGSAAAASSSEPAECVTERRVSAHAASDTPQGLHSHAEKSAP